MSKKAPKAKSKTPVAKLPESPAGVHTPAGFMAQLPVWTPYMVIFLFSFLLYSDTLWNNYALDDMMVLVNNRFTKMGTAGIKEHFTHDMFEGEHGGGLSPSAGGRYRPLSLISLSVEYELLRKLRGDKRTEINNSNVIIGENDPYLCAPFSHGINIVLFALTCLVLYYLLIQIVPVSYSFKFPSLARYGLSWITGLPFWVTMLYAAHPIHTEAVANIKGRDEVMCMLFSLLSLLAAIKYAQTQNIIHLVCGAPVYFLALLSKENAITFLGIIPLTYYFFTPAAIKNYVIVTGLYLIPVAVFLLLRNQYTHVSLALEPSEILHNPFLLATASQKYATIILTFLYYIWLLVFPYSLTHDYYYNQIPYVDPGNGLFILALIINIALVVYAFMHLKSKSPAAYGILFFYITLSIVSNVFFTVGMLMNERFIYMASLGFCIFASWLLIHYVKNQKIALVVLSVTLSLYALKTISRNLDWKNNLTLLSSDIHYSPNSIRLRTVLGNELTQEAIKCSDTIEKNRLLDSAIANLHVALNIYPANSVAWLHLANAIYNRNHNAEEAITLYQKAIDYYGGPYYVAYLNIGTVFNAGNQAQSAKEWLSKADALKPEASDCKYMLAAVSAKLDQPDSVEYWLKRGAEFRTIQASDYYAVGKGFALGAHDMDKAIEYLQKAIIMNPTSELYYEDLGVAYANRGDFPAAIATTEKIVQLNPDYANAYRNLYILYKRTGNEQLSNQYLQRYNQLVVSAKNKP